MKKNYFLSLILLLSGLITIAQVYQGSEAKKRIRGAEMLRYKEGKILPDYLKLTSDARFPLDQLSSWLKTNYFVSRDMAFNLKGTGSGNLKDGALRFRQTYLGTPVYDAVFIAQVSDNAVIALHGTVYQDIMTANQVLLSESQALVHALKKIPSQRYKWEMPEEEAFLKYSTGDEKASYYPAGTLVLFPDKSGETIAHRYAWMFNIYSDKPLSRADIYIDAQTGAGLFQNDRIHVSNAPGTAVTKYSGTQEIITDSYVESFRLRETSRGNGIETFDMNQGTSYGNSVDFTDSDNYWNNFNPQLDEVATDAHWGAEMTYDYYWLNYGRNSIDSMGFKLISYVHYDQSYANAFWDGERMTYGDGNSTWSPLTTVDICAHEITHGLTSFTADLEYSYESGALNEAYSDIFGTSVEFFAKPATANWTVGEDIGSFIRNMEDPNSMGDPDTYLGQYWYTGSGDNGGVHTNSNVLNYWFYLASVGGNGTNDNGDTYSVNGIGIEKAGAIAYRTLVHKLDQNSQYEDARFYSILSAQELFGGCSPEVETVTNAFYAIGVGQPFSPVVTVDFDASVTSSCSLPVDIQFSNNTINGSTYNWNFGDGTTLTLTSLTSPVHTYTSEGVFTVTLDVDGGACGTGTLTKTGYISVDAPEIPVVTSASTCDGPASLTLTAIAPDSVRWFTTPTGGVPFYTGTTYTTPLISQTEHYFVESQISQPDVYVGKPNNTGGGSYFTSSNQHYLKFNVYAPIIIKSVKVYSQGSGLKSVYLRGSDTITIMTATVNIPNGESRIDLNFPVGPGMGYQLLGPGSPNLYRNNNGVNYPYTVSDLVSVITSDAGNQYYYYFYDWEIEQPACHSTRLPVTAYINYGIPQASFTFAAFPLVVVFGNSSTDGEEYLWDFGDGNTSTEKNPVHYYDVPAQYSVTLTVNNSCGSDIITQQVLVLATDAPETGKQFNMTLSPVPAKESIHIGMEAATLTNANLTIVDMLGNTVRRLSLGNISGNWHELIDLVGIKQGTYLMDIRHDQGRITKRFIIQ